MRWGYLRTTHFHHWARAITLWLRLALAARNGCSCSKRQPGPALEPRMARNDRFELAPEPQKIQVLLESAPEPQNDWCVPLATAPERKNSGQVLLEQPQSRSMPCRCRPSLAPHRARKVPLSPVAVRCLRCLRSKWPLKECCLFSFIMGILFPWLHYLYIYIYIYV